MNTTLRIILAFFIVLGGGLYYFVDQISGDIRHRYQEVLEESINDQARILSSMVEEDMSHHRPFIKNLGAVFTRAYRKRFHAKIYEFVKTEVNLRVYVTDSSGTVLYDSLHPDNQGKDFSRWNDVYLTLRGKYGARSTRANPEDPYSGAIYVAAPIHDENNRLVGVLTVAKPKDSIEAAVGSARAKLIRVGLIVSFSMVVSFLLVFVWITAPIRRLTRYVHQVRQNKRAVLPNLGTSEIKELGTAFEMLRTELEGRKYIEQYVQTLTHEIKSPLTSIRGAAELLEEEMSVENRARFIGNIRIESSRIEEIIGRLLNLASIENRDALKDLENFAIRELIDGIIAGAAPELRLRTLGIQSDCPEGLSMEGERFLIRQAINNLLQNAIDFARRDTTIRVSVAEKDGWIQIRILDQGDSIPDYAVSRIFERFYSLPRGTGRKSTGLGLPFVKEVANLHGGDVFVKNVEGGVESALILPRAQVLE